MKRDLRKLFAAAKARGWIISRTKSDHLKLVHQPTGRIVYAGTTPSCWRSLQNLLGDLRRVERAMQETTQ